MTPLCNMHRHRWAKKLRSLNGAQSLALISQTQILVVSNTLAYIKKGHTPIQVFPVLNVYTNSFVVCSGILCILSANCNTPLNRNAYYAWANNRRIGVCIQDRIYLNRCTPFLDVSLWIQYHGHFPKKAALYRYSPCYKEQICKLLCPTLKKTTFFLNFMVLNGARSLGLKP